MFGMIVLLIAVTALVGICGVVDHCFAALPKAFHKVSGKLIWLSITAFMVCITGNILLRNAPEIGALIMLGGVALYFVVRGISFLGLAYSYAAFGREHSVMFSSAGLFWAWSASFVDALGVVAIVIMMIAHSIGGTVLSKDEFAGYVNLIKGAMAGGIFLTVFFLMAMNSNKNAVIAQERAERKKKTDDVLLARKNTRVSSTEKVTRAGS